MYVLEIDTNQLFCLSLVYLLELTICVFSVVSILGAIIHSQNTCDTSKLETYYFNFFASQLYSLYKSGCSVLRVYICILGCATFMTYSILGCIHFTLFLRTIQTFCNSWWFVTPSEPLGCFIKDGSLNLFHPFK